ncbi:alpha/beta fold hydrolase [Gluconobacter frateurii]|uniref:alpha/beta hydrolase n=1 Tax=Gluconobacter frateurii TaxID=38308 RepID=UPI001F057C45|nr:alpha/beta fold hydrolase [Gluconobacter frateurii]UMM09068.1 alpha/beta fold hydrolase [Gluconobacter frateurii]
MYRFRHYLLLLGVMTLLPSTALAAKERSVEAPGPQGVVAGTFLDAGAKKPVVLLFPGSGANDRNGNSLTSIKPATLRLLAEGLAEHGISSVRIDKRGMFGSARAIPDANNVTIHDYVMDVQSWINTIQHQTGVSCVWVAGHSEGALVALASASSVKPLCGLILLSAQGRPPGEVLRSQLHAEPGAQVILPQIDGALNDLEAGKTVDPQTLHPGLRALFRPAVQHYLIDEMHYDPAKLAGAYQGPMLLVQGGRDAQISPVADFAPLKAAAPKADALYLPDANHMLKDVQGTDKADFMKAYTDSTVPLDPKLVPHIAEFVLNH